MHQNEKGFSPIELVLVIVVVALVGLSGWLIWDRQQNKSANVESTPTTSNTVSSTDKDNESTKQTQEKQAQKFLTIKEWGIKIPLSVELETLSYVYREASNPQAPDSISFNTQTLIQADPYCDSEKSPTGGIGSMSRSKTLKGEPNDSTKLGEYYFKNTDGTSNPCGATEEARLLAEKQSSALSDALSKIELQ